MAPALAVEVRMANGWRLCAPAIFLAAACGEDDEEESGYANACRVDEGESHYELKWDQDTTSRFVELSIETPSVTTMNQCTQLDITLPPACSYMMQTFCRISPDSAVSEPCTRTLLAVVKGGHLVLEGDFDGFIEVGRCR